jgi:hypothetical protein
LKTYEEFVKDNFEDSEADFLVNLANESQRKIDIDRTLSSAGKSKLLKNLDVLLGKDKETQIRLFELRDTIYCQEDRNHVL